MGLGLAGIGCAALLGVAAFSNGNNALVQSNNADVNNVGGPLHASCKLTWNFPSTSCADVSSALLSAATDMGKQDGWQAKCGTSSEKCGYELKLNGANKVSGTHTTPVKAYVDDLTFTLVQGADGKSCTVEGYSTSEVFYAVLDYSTNYCNLSNLGTHTGLNYAEQTSDSICTQYSSRNCDKY